MNHSRWRNTEKLFFIFAFILLNAMSAFAGPSRTTYQAKIVKPDGYPLEAASVNFKFTILDPAGSCILYSETYSSVNMSLTGGLISFALGSGVKTYPVSATTFEQVFSNITPSLSCDTGGPANYSPGASDARKIVMQFHDGTGWQTLPAMAINAVPYAMYANSAQNLNGKVDTDFVQVANVSTCGAGEALSYNGASFSCVTIPAPQTVSAAAVVAALGYTPADGVSVTALSSSLSSTNADVSSVSSTVASVSSTVFSVSSTVSSLSNTVSNLSTTVSGLSASMAAITSSQWVTSGTTISYNSGFIGIGTTNPAARLDVSGGIRLGLETATCAAGLAGTLRYNSGTVEYCNGTSWLPFGVAGAGITNVNGSTSGAQTFATGITGTVFNISTVNGVHTFNIPLAASSSVTAGLLSNADYLTFANKLNATSAAVISALGFTPANDAVSGTYAQKANNLSDLASATVARTNLGLGFLATLNFLDLSSSQASGTLAVARLPAFSGDASSSAGSAVLTLASVGAGVTSGAQYTKVTVDGKGRVISGSQLSSSDVTTALGFTPGAATSGVTSLNGSTSQTQTFANGTTGTAPQFNTANGVHTLNIPLASAGSVTAGLLSNADYTSFANKITSSAAAIAQVLGYAPVSSTTLGNYVLRSNNLSDLTSATVARTNLGLGSLATANFVDLGTSQASGTLAAARLPAFSGDATSSLGSSVLTLASVGAGVTSGTQYTKVTVDGKGRVVSGAQLSVTDVTTALGYTPASASASTQWSNNGPSIYYNTGSIGVGTSTPTALFHIARSAGTTIGQTSSNTANAGLLIEGGGTGVLAFDGNEIQQFGDTLFLRGENGINFSAGDGADGDSTTPMVITRTSRVGFGTTSPAVANHFSKSTTIGSVGSLNLNNSVVRIQEAASTTLNFDGNTIVAEDDLFIGTKGTGLFQFFSNDTVRMAIGNTGNIGIGVTAPSAKLQIVSGTTSLAPLKFTSGALTTTAQAGAVEYDGSNLYFTDGTNTRRTLTAGSGSGSIDNASTINSTGNITMVPVGSVVVSSTTPSTNSSTGALIVKGGMGVAGDIYASGTIVTSQGIQGLEIKATSATITPYVYGSTASGGSLRLESTTHASKGNVLLASGGGNVGVNISNPSSPLHVQGSAGSSTVPWMTLEGGGGVLDNIALRLFDRGSATSNNNSIEFMHMGPSSNGVATARVRSLNSGTFASGGSSLFLETTSDASGTWNNSQLVLNRNGFVGVKTANPSGVLHVADSSAADIRLENTGAVSSALRILSQNGYNYFESGASFGAGSGADIRFTNMMATSTWMTMQASTGNVGIGTTNPSTRLMVVGDSDNTTFYGSANDVRLDVDLPSATYAILDSVNKAGTVGRALMLQSSGGFVGVGVSNPISAFQVAGDIRVGYVSPVGSADVSGTGNRLYFSGGPAENGRDSDNSDVISFNRYNHMNDVSDLQLNLGDNGSSDAFTIGYWSAGAHLSTIKMTASGLLGIGAGINPGARLQITSGTTSIAPLKFTSGSLVSTPQAGAFEYDGTDFYVTDSSGIRRTIATATSAGTLDDVTVVSSPSGIALWPAAGNSVTVSATTASTNSSTGALIVKGGLGVAGNIYSSGTIITSSNIQGSEVTATSATITPYVYGSTVSGGSLRLESTTHASKGNVLLASGGGNVGIGTSSPATKLDVRVNDGETVRIIGGTGAVSESSYYNAQARARFGYDGSRSAVAIDDRNDSGATTTKNIVFDNAGFERMRINTTGNVGIGTSSPGAKLHVENSSTSSGEASVRVLQPNQPTGSSHYIKLGHDVSTTYNAADIAFVYSGNNSNQNRLDFGFQGIAPVMVARADGNVGIGNANPGTQLDVTGHMRLSGVGSEIEWNAGGPRLRVAAGNTLAFHSGGGLGSAANERMRIDSSGNVGIGTTTPATMLHVFKSTTMGSVGSLNLNNAVVRIQESSGTSLNFDGNMIVAEDELYIGTKYANNFTLLTSDTVRLFVNGSSGNVGIGTTSPAQKLSVVGDVSVTGQVTSRDFFEKTVSIADGWAIGDYVEIVQGAPGAAGSSSIWEVHLSGTRNSWTEATTYIITGTHSAGSSWREAPHSYENGYVGGSKCFTVDINGNVNTPQFRIRAIKASASCGVTGTSLPLNFRIRSIGANASWTNLSATGTGATVVGMQSMGLSWNLYTGNPQNNGTPAIHANSNGNVGIGTTAPVAVLHSKNAALVGGNPATTGTTDAAILQRIEANTGVLDIGMQSSGSVWLQPRDRTNLASNFNLLLNSNGGNVGIGTTAPAYKLDVNGTLRGFGITDSSDIRLKKQIQPLDLSLEKVLSIKGVSYYWKDTSMPKKQIGFIAQDLEKVYPELVETDPKGMKSVNYSHLIAPLIEAFKALYTKIVVLFDRTEKNAREIASVTQENAELKARVEKTEKENEELKKRLDRIEKALLDSQPNSK